MKLVTILGTRPELIRLSRIIPKLDTRCDHTLIHTGQNYDDNLNKIFMDELGIRHADYSLGATGSFGEQIANMMPKLEQILTRVKPDAFLVLGDTNSSLGAIMAKRLGIRVFHMEAGNRCFDDRSPEEVNRRIIDHSSDILLPYTERSRQNLLDEGIHSSRIYVTGNPIKEVIDTLQLKYVEGDYILVTLHRQENVDDPKRLATFVEAMAKLAYIHHKKVIWPIHPRTKKNLGHIIIPSSLELIEPVGFKRFVSLEKNAYCVLTDSGTVQEECAIFNTPVVTLRDTTERPETVEIGANFISGCDVDKIINGVKIVANKRAKASIPPEYLVNDVSDRIVNIVLGYYR